MINPDQIIYITYQMRQLEIHRNSADDAKKKETLTLQIRKMKEQLDPMLIAYANEKKLAQKTPMPQFPKTPKKFDNRDHGPEEVVENLHYAIKSLPQSAAEFVHREPISIAGEFNGMMYLVHIEKATIKVE